MSKQNYEAGRASSATHRLTRASTTLDRRYVHRPGNLAIEEAALEAQKAAERAASEAPSRLVNLGIHRAELEAAQQRAQDAQNRAEQVAEGQKVKTMKKDKAAPKPIAIFPHVVEMGGEDDNQAENIAVDFSSSKAPQIAQNSDQPAESPQSSPQANNSIALTTPSLVAPPTPEPDLTSTLPAQFTNYAMPETNFNNSPNQTNDTSAFDQANANSMYVPEYSAYNNYSATPDSTYAMIPATNTYEPDSYAASVLENSEYYMPMTGVSAGDVMSMPAATSNALTSTTQSAAVPFDQSQLAMNIAADYAAASLGASVAEYGNNYQSYAMNEPTAAEPANLDLAIDRAHHSPSSVEEIARTAAEAIAKINLATDPDEIAEQISALKTLAEKIRKESDAPEIKELSDTIDKFVNVAMKSTSVKEAMERKAKADSEAKSAVSVKTSSKPAAKNTKVTLSRGATRAAAKVTRSSAKAMAVSRANSQSATQLNRAVSRPSSAARNKTTTIKSASQHSAQSIKNSARNAQLKSHSNTPHKTAAERERALRQAMRSAATMNDSPTDSTRSKKKREVARTHKKSAGKRFLIAFSCATACVGVFFYFVSSNMPDISVRVAAMQTGIEASYPSYVPRGYSLSDVASENGKIGMKFSGPDDASFTLIEEKSSWDSAALERNFVKPTWSDKYTTTHEQGITIYICGSDAAWVNGGILYKISSSSDTLTKKQLRNIVVSL